MKGYFDRAVTAAAGVTGRRFGALVASSVLATSAIVTSAMTGTGYGPLAGLIGSSLAAAGPSKSVAPQVTAPPPVAAVPQGGSAAPAATAAASGGPVAPAPAAPAPVAEPPAGTPPEAPAPAPPEPAPEPGRVQHVFVIALTSSGYDASFGQDSQMPYLADALRPDGELLSNYSLLDPAVLPNNIAMVSGQPPNPLTRKNCPTYKDFPVNAAPDDKGRVHGSGCVYPVLALSLADQLGISRLTWHAYMEDMADEFGPGNCVHPDFNGPDQPEQGGYATRQNPFAYFHSLLDLGDCATNDVPLTELKGDLRNAKSTANFSFISPNLCHAGVEGQCENGATGPASADQFLKRWVPLIRKSPAFRHDGLLVITFAGANPSDLDANAESTRVGTLLLSRYLAPNTARGADYGPYALLRSIEDLFALDHLAEANARGTPSFAAELLGSG